MIAITDYMKPAFSMLPYPVLDEAVSLIVPDLSLWLVKK